MMGHTHAVSGAALWLAGCTAATAAGLHPDPWHVVAGTVVCAGAALLPDLDHPQSTIAHSLGPLTYWLARGTDRLARRVYSATATPADGSRNDGHRALTHTAVFAIAAGLLVSAVTELTGRAGGALVLTVMVALGLRGLLAKTRRQVRAFTPMAALGAGALALWVLPPAGGWWLGLPVAAGCLIHDLGDGATNSGVPLLWLPIPVRICGCRWYRVGLPNRLRIRTGSDWESVLLVPLLAVGALAAGVGVAVL